MNPLTSQRLRFAIQIYDCAWQAALPLLRRNPRLKEGWSQRKLQTPLPAADLWVQAASGGEAYLAWTLLGQLHPRLPLRVLVTTNTGQGMEILEKARADLAPGNPNLHLSAAFFPFDRPSIMKQAVAQVAPRLMVLLETEIWPGLLYSLKQTGRPAYIINGRMTEKSLSRYRKFPRIFSSLRPEKVLAISSTDASRYQAVFGPAGILVISNIKFDRVTIGADDTNLPENSMIMAGIPFLVLGSVREEEEPEVEQIISMVRESRPETVIGLFPRHMHRVDHWRDSLGRAGIAFRLRSASLGSTIKPGEVIIWDTFGELANAYASATAVFVGGSLAPLGGQNFLEPLAYGIMPVIGPYYENFAWIGEEIFSRGLVEKCKEWQAVAARLINLLDQPPSRERIRSEAEAFIRARQGGTEQACRVIRDALRQ